MQLRDTQQGFTIFEALIYIALFTFVIGGGILSAFQIFQGSANIQSMTERETELNFVLRKIDWALNGADGVSIVGGELVVDRGGTDYTFSTDGVTVIMDVEGDDSYDLTSSRIDISDMSFSPIVGNPKMLEFTLTIDGDVNGPFTRYIR